MTDRPAIILLTADGETPTGVLVALEEFGSVRRISSNGRGWAASGADLLVGTSGSPITDREALQQIRAETDAPILLLSSDEVPAHPQDFDDTVHVGDLEGMAARTALLLEFRANWQRTVELGLTRDELRHEFARYGLDPEIVGERGLRAPGRVLLKYLVEIEAVTRQQDAICRLMGTAQGTFLFNEQPQGLPGPDGKAERPVSALSPYCAYLQAQGGQCTVSEHEASRKAMLTGQPAESICTGKIGLYSVPVSLSFGGLRWPLYAATVATGVMPTDRDDLGSAAAHYGVNPEILGQMATESRFWVLNPDKADEIRSTLTNLAETVSREVSQKYATAYQLFLGVLKEAEIRRSERLLSESHRALEKTNTLLKTKNEEIYELTHAITHDLKKPLSGMKAAVAMLYRGHLGALEGTQLEAAGTALEATEYMQALVGDLLEAARLDVGRRLLDIREVDVPGVIRRIERRFHYDLEQKGVTLEFIGLPDQLECDESGLEKVLMNLIGNAVSYIGDGEKRVTVTAEEREGMVRITVADTGLGIPDEEQSRVFEKFRRGPNVRGISGTGLGLAIVKGIIEAHGGEVSLDSQVDRGTTIAFSLPLRSLVASASDGAGEGVLG